MLALAGGTVQGTITTTGGRAIVGQRHYQRRLIPPSVVIAPGTPTTVGTITTTKDLTLDPGSVFAVKVGNSGPVLISDLLLQTGGTQGIDLGNSNLSISLLPGYVATVGDMFTIVSSPVLGILGQFANAPDEALCWSSPTFFMINYVLDPSFTFVVGITLTCVA